MHLLHITPIKYGSLTEVIEIGQRSDLNRYTSFLKLYYVSHYSLNSLAYFFFIHFFFLQQFSYSSYTDASEILSVSHNFPFFSGCTYPDWMFFPVVLDYYHTKLIHLI